VGKRMVCARFWWGNLRERDHLKDPGVDGNIKVDLQEVEYGSMDWIETVQNRYRGRALVNTVMKLWDP